LDSSASLANNVLECKNERKIDSPFPNWVNDGVTSKINKFFYERNKNQFEGIQRYKRAVDKLI